MGGAASSQRPAETCGGPPVAVALRFNVPAAAMKLVSAIIVAVAISMPAIQEKIAFEKRRSAPRQARKERV